MNDVEFMEKLIIKNGDIGIFFKHKDKLYTAKVTTDDLNKTWDE